MVGPRDHLVAEIVTNTFGRSPTENDWRYPTILMFDDASLHPNSSWEMVNNSCVVQLIQGYIQCCSYRLHIELSSPFTCLRNTHNNRREARARSFYLRSIAQVYRFTDSEIMSQFSRFHPVHHVGLVENREMQLNIWNKFSINNGCLFPIEPQDMYIARNTEREGIVDGFVLNEQGTLQIGPLVAVDEFTAWSILATLVEYRVYDESRCITVCLALLEENVQDALINGNGSFLYSATVAQQIQVIE